MAALFAIQSNGRAYDRRGLLLANTHDRLPGDPREQQRMVFGSKGFSGLHVVHSYLLESSGNGLLPLKCIGTTPSGKLGLACLPIYSAIISACENRLRSSQTAPISGWRTHGRLRCLSVRR